MTMPKLIRVQAWSGIQGCRRLRIPQFLQNRHTEVARVVSYTHRPPSTPRKYPGIISVRSWVDLRATVRPEGLSQWKVPMTPYGNRTRDLLACSAVRLSHSKVHQQVTKAQRGSRGIALSVTWATDLEGWSSQRPGRFTLGKQAVLIA